MISGINIYKEEKVESPNTALERFNDIEISRRDRILEYLTNSLENKSNEKVIYIEVSTHYTKQEILDISKRLEIKPLYHYSMRSLSLWFMFVPGSVSRRFVIKISNTKLIKKVFELYDNYSLIELFYFNEKYEKEFLDDLKIKKIFYNSEKIVKQDSEYLIYGIDMDSAESETDIMEFFSYGINTDKSLTWFL